MAGTDTSAQQAAEQACDRLQLVVPDEIRRYKQWVLWRYEPGDDKPRKVPYYANGSRRSGVQGSESDLAQLSTFDAAVAKLRRGGFDGVGLAILPNSPIKAIDLDACVVAGKLLPQAEAIVVEADSYAEISPSGTGVRILAFGVLPSKKAMHRFGPGQHLELFGTSGFVTITGNTLGATTIRPMPAAFQSWVIQQVTGASDAAPQEPRPAHTVTIDSTQRAHLRSALTALDADNYGVWCDMGLALKSLGDVGRSLWLEWSQLSPRFDAGQAAKKWAGFEPDGRINYQTVFYRAADLQWVNPASAVAVAAAPPTGSTELPLVFAEDITADAVNLSQLVEDVLTVGGLSVMYGESNSGKSFLACDMDCSIGAGVDWLGKRTVRSAVMYVAGEGAESIKLRVLAWRIKHGIDPWLAVVPVAVNLLDPLADASKIIDAAMAVEARYHCKVEKITIDTLARAFGGGNENASEDMGAVIATADLIRQATGAHVMFVHHAGKDASKGSRGHSSLKAATDTEIEVTGDSETKLHCAKITKQRDLGSRGDELMAKFSVVMMGTDQWGKPITTCVVDSTDIRPSSKRAKGSALEIALIATLAAAPNKTLKRSELVKALTDQDFTSSPIYRALQQLSEQQVITEVLSRVHLNGRAKSASSSSEE